MKVLITGGAGFVGSHNGKVYKEGFEDMERRVPDISKIKKLVWFSPKYNLNEILKNTIEYYKQKVHCDKQK